MSCTSLRTVSLTQIPKNRSKKVYAEVSKTIFLGFNFDNDFVDQLTSKLRARCKNGKITGILTKDEQTFYFLTTNRKISARGYCVN